MSICYSLFAILSSGSVSRFNFLRRAIGDKILATFCATALGKNINGYFGEGIDIDAVLSDCVAAARVHGVGVSKEISGSPKAQPACVFPSCIQGSAPLALNQAISRMNRRFLLPLLL